MSNSILMMYHFQIVCKSSFFKHVRFQYLYLPHNLYDLGIFVFNWANVGFWNDINIVQQISNFIFLATFNCQPWSSKLTTLWQAQIHRWTTLKENDDYENKFFNESGFSFLITYLRTAFASKTNALCKFELFVAVSYFNIFWTLKG